MNSFHAMRNVKINADASSCTETSRNTRQNASSQLHPSTWADHSVDSRSSAAQMRVRMPFASQSPADLTVLILSIDQGVVPCYSGVVCRSRCLCDRLILPMNLEDKHVRN